jgi:hypothetical protein
MLAPPIQLLPNDATAQRFLQAAAAWAAFPNNRRNIALRRLSTTQLQHKTVGTKLNGCSEFSCRSDGNVASQAKFYADRE